MQGARRERCFAIVTDERRGSGPKAARPLGSPGEVHRRAAAGDGARCGRGGGGGGGCPLGQRAGGAGGRGTRRPPPLGVARRSPPEGVASLARATSPRYAMLLPGGLLRAITVHQSRSE